MGYFEPVGRGELLLYLHSARAGPPREDTLLHHNKWEKCQVEVKAAGAGEKAVPGMKE